MFTGLVQRRGSLEALAGRDGGAVLAVRHAPWEEPLVPGESVAVQGVCLTVTAVAAGRFECDVLAETLARTNLGAARPGCALNLERALRAGERLGGHIVQGHVDGIGTVRGIRAAGRDHVLRVRIAPEIAAGIVLKGSIACDGVSLTVSAREANAFEAAIIPTTWRETSLSERRPGDTVNIETDVLGRYAARRAEPEAGREGITLDALRRAGFG